MLDGLRREFRPMLALAWPVVVAELGWMLMGIVDTIMVGRLAPEAIGAVGLGGSVFVAVGVFGMGILLGLDTFVSQAFGARSIVECHRWLLHGLYLALLVSAPLTLLALAVAATMPAWGMHPAVLVLVQPYLEIVAWSTLPLLVYAACRRYLQAMNLVRPVMFVLLAANVVDAVLNYMFIFGKFGAPAMGTAGAAWTTVVGRVFMAGALLAVIALHERRERLGLAGTPLAPDWARLWRLVRLGVPAATQVTAEVGVFAAATALAARLDPIQLASHQIALTVASVTFMVPLGVASAGAVRVGQAVGRGDPHDVRHAGWTALAIGVGFMAFAALSFVVAPTLIIRVFTADTAVIASGVSLLAIAAAFQMFDGMQGVATGILRGLGDTRTAMLSNLGGHWLLGMPVAYTLCFTLGWGVPGLWIGLSLGLILVSLVLVATWAARTQRLSAETMRVPS
jgi:MATE family multidrug resistance protein